MIGKNILHYKILEKLRQKYGGQVGEAHLLLTTKVVRGKYDGCLDREINIALYDY
jgi:hypothetical protein